MVCCLFRKRQVVISHEPALASRLGVHTDGSGRHSSNPHFRRCGVGYYTDTGESVFLPLTVLKQSVHRAELLVTVRALEECKPKGIGNIGYRLELLGLSGVAGIDSGILWSHQPK
eukprot:6486743-Amphidinium_carterae.2